MLHRLGYRAETGEDVKRLANIKLTLEAVRRETEGVTYIECFRKSNFRRTIVSITPLVVQQFSGIVFAAGYSTYYAQLAGYSTDVSFCAISGVVFTHYCHISSSGAKDTIQNCIFTPETYLFGLLTLFYYPHETVY